MKEESIQVLVFKTNINSDTDKQLVKSVLHSHDLIKEASVDTEDVDRVLRIVAQQIQPEEIITIVNKQGFSCQELD